jgi:sugar-phosphatase
MIEAVIFDMDGVLIDSEPFWKEAEIGIFNNLGVPLTEELCETTVGMRLADVTKLWHDKFPWDLNEHPYELVNKKIIDRLLELIVEKGTLNKGVTGLFELFRSKGIKMAIASSSDKRIIDTVVDKFGIRENFSSIHSGESEKFGKPHPAIYLTTAKALGVSPKNCLVFEDSFYGIISAIAAGMKTAAYPEKTNFYNPKFDIADIKLRTLPDFTEEEYKKIDNK